MEILSWGIGLPIQLQRCCAPGDEHHPCIFCMWSSKIMMKIDENWWKLITSWWNIMISMMKYHVVMKFVPSVNIRNPKKIPLPLGLQELATCFDHFDLWKSVQWEIPVVFRCPNCECRHVTGAWDSRTLLGSTPLELRFPSTACKLLISEGFIWIYMDLSDSSPDPTSATELPSFEAGPVNQQRSGPFLPLRKWKFWAAAILRTPYSCIRCRSRCNLRCPMMSQYQPTGTLVPTIQQPPQHFEVVIICELENTV